MPAPAIITVSALAGTNGFRIDGAAAGDHAGRAVSSAGDVNGDGFEDLIIGAWAADPNGAQSGASYVVFGRASGFAANLNLSTLDGTTGFRINGESTEDRSSGSVASAGDVNGDGFDDLIIGAHRADPNGIDSGASYVVFGQASGFGANLDLSTLNGTNGFQINGEGAEDRSGLSVAAAGDVNGDGFDDLIVGAEGADPHGAGSGASYVVFGQASGFAANLNLSTLDGTNGFQINGEAADDQSGCSVASAGDINGDGFDDLIIGAEDADPNGIDSGASYVVFGRSSGFGPNLNLSTLDGTNGFQISGAQEFDHSGLSVASAGDVNGDGFADLIIGRFNASHVVFGQASGFSANLNLSTLNGTNGFRINGATGFDFFGWSVASAGDINGDGFDDLIIGSPRANPNGPTSGASLVLFGRASGFGADVNLSTLDGTNGFQVNGEAANEYSGSSVASAGDINGDGFDDLIIGAGDPNNSAGRGDPNGPVSGPSYLLFGSAFGAATVTTGTAAADRVIGTTGADTLTGGGGADVFRGGAGHDRLVLPTASDFADIDGGTGLDTLAFTGAGTTLDLTTTLPAKILSIEAIDLTGSGNNTLIIDRLAALDLTEERVGGVGILRVTGNAGDTVSFAYVPDWTLAGSVTEGATLFDRYVATGVELRIAAAVGVRGLVTDGPDSLTGTAMNETIHGHGGDDTITGLDGADHLSGGSGHDSISGGSGRDTVAGGSGNDTLTGDGDVDTLDFSDSDGAIAVDLGTTVLQDMLAGGSDLISGFEAVNGSRFNDTIGGGAAHDTLAGQDGDDVITAGGGEDRVAGGVGNDLLEGGSGNDILDGGAGNDTHNAGEGKDVLRASAGADSFDGGGGIDLVDYRAAALIRVFLDGSGTNAGNAGGDRLAGIEKLAGAVGNDFLVGDGAGNRLSGFNGDDTIWGRAGADQLEGMVGNDRLYGGPGHDVLVGGAGNDVFVFSDAPMAGGVDRTNDFVVGEDLIEIDASVFGGGLVAGGAVQFVAGAAPSAAGFTGGVFLFNTTNGFLGFDADGGGAGAVEYFFRLQNLPVGFGAADFTVVA